MRPLLLQPAQPPPANVVTTAAGTQGDSDGVTLALSVRLPVTDGVKVSVAVLDGDGDALLEGRPDPVKEVVEVLLPQSVALDVKEEEGVTVGETDTVPVVDDV